MTCDQVYLPEIRSWLQMHPAGFEQAYPPRQVNSLYLDTPEMDCLSDHLDGALERSKLRFRWYGRDHAAVQGVLELKHRSNRFGWKEYSPVPVTFDLTTILWHHWMQQLRAYAKGNIAVWLTWRDQPTLVDSYVREYYESIDQRIRVTVDHDQVIYDQVAYPMPNLSSCAPSDGQIVVEVKSGPHLCRRLSDVLSSFPFRAGRNSKYVCGMEKRILQ
jgi:hypothetical protein